MVEKSSAIESNDILGDGSAEKFMSVSISSLENENNKIN